MNKKEVIRSLLNDAQKHYAEEEWDKLDKIAEAIMLVDEHSELFSNLLKYTEEFGKEDMLVKLRKYRDILDEVTNQFGFIHGVPLLEDVTECIQFFEEIYH